MVMDEVYNGKVMGSKPVISIFMFKIIFEKAWRTHGHTDTHTDIPIMYSKIYIIFFVELLGRHHTCLNHIKNSTLHSTTSSGK